MISDCVWAQAGQVMVDCKTMPQAIAARGHGVNLTFTFNRLSQLKSAGFGLPRYRYPIPFSKNCLEIETP
jgi:hypothetical protein